MTKFDILRATALSLTLLAVATPALAAGRGGGGGGWHGGGGMHFSGGGMHAGGAFRGAAASPAFASQSFRGTQASMGPAAGARGNFAGPGGAQFAQGGYRGGWHGDQDRHFGRGLGFAAGLAAGSALGYGYSDPGYYDAYNDYSYDQGYPGYVEQGPAYAASGGVVDPSYCAQRYRSYDPASGTYLGFDGLRHPCE